MEDLRPHHQRQLEALAKSLASNTARIKIKKKTISNRFQYNGRQATDARLIDLSAFNKPLYLDAKQATLEVQGLATYETIVDYTFASGFLPTIAPGLKHITVAGAIAGVAIESNCAKYGFAHDGLLEADVLLPTGEIVTCTSDNQYADLFHALPNSYGTLGYILRAKIKLRPAKPYVVLETNTYPNVQTLLTAMQQATEQTDVDYIESLAYGKDKLLLTLGRQTNTLEGDVLSIYGKTKFYEEISRPGKLTLTSKDYIFRYDPEWFWALPKSKVFTALRPIAPISIRNSGFYSKVMFSKFAKQMGIGPKSDFELLIQDWEVPWDQAAALLTYAFNTIELDGQPWLFGPIRSPGTATLYPVTKGNLYLNLGCYGSARKKPGDEPFLNTKLMDAFCIEHGGIKMLYSSSFMDKQTFDRLYGGRSYVRIKQKYDPNGLAPTLYEKAVH